MTEDLKEIISIECLVTGVSFCEKKKLESLRRAMFIREPANPHNEFAIAVMVGDKQLGHIEKNFARYLAPIMVCFQLRMVTSLIVWCIV